MDGYMLSHDCEIRCHAFCDDGRCDCDCHDQAELKQRQSMLCTCRDCGTSFATPYSDDVESYICDACIAKPRERPKGDYK